MSPNKQAVKWYPRLFTGDMVRALLDGRKTATRWPLRKQPVEDVSHRAGKWVWEDVAGNVFRAPVCPGDVIWARETWAHREGGPVYDDVGHVIDSFESETIYRASRQKNKGPWKPNIHMPRRYARIFLRVNDIKLIRVQNTSEAEAESEGVVPEFEMDVADFARGKRTEITYYLGFKHIWQRLYDGGLHAWKANPYVWRATFHRISKAEAEA